MVCRRRPVSSRSESCARVLARHLAPGPRVAMSTQPIRLSSVVLPLPEGPAMEMNSPGCTSSDTPRSAGTTVLPSWYSFTTSTMLHDGIAHSSPRPPRLPRLSVAHSRGSRPCLFAHLAKPDAYAPPRGVFPCALSARSRSLKKREVEGSSHRPAFSVGIVAPGDGVRVPARSVHDRVTDGRAGATGARRAGCARGGVGRGYGLGRGWSLHPIVEAHALPPGRSWRGRRRRPGR